MTSKKELLDAHSRYADEVAPALDQMTIETMRTEGPANALAWLGVVVGAFVICLALLVVLAGG
jgi:hypothetical protein